MKNYNSRRLLNTLLTIAFTVSLAYIILYQTVFINMEEAYDHAYNHGVLTYDIFLAVFAGLVVYALTVMIPANRRKRDMNKKIADHAGTIVTWSNMSIGLLITKICHNYRLDADNYQDTTFLWDYIAAHPEEEEDARITMGQIMEGLYLQMKPELEKILKLIDPEHGMYDLILRLHRGSDLGSFVMSLDGVQPKTARVLYQDLTTYQAEIKKLDRFFKITLK